MNPSQMQIQRTLLWRNTLIALLLLGIVSLIWLPFNFKLGVVLEPWGLVNDFDIGEPLFWGINASRPLTWLGWQLAYFLTPDSFIGANFVMLVLWWAKAVLVYLIVRRLLPSTVLAFGVAVLYTVYPADYALLWMSGINQHQGVFFFLLATYSLLRLWDSHQLYSQLVWGGVMALSIFISLGTYEVGYPLIYTAPILLLWLIDGRFPRRFWKIVGVWYLVAIVITIPQFGVITGSIEQSTGYYVGLLDTGEKEGSFILAAMQSTLNMFIRHFITAWQEAFQHWQNFLQSGHSNLFIASIGAGVLATLATLWFWRSDEGLERYNWRRQFLILAAGLVIMVLGFAAFLPSSLRDTHTRTYYYNSLGSALVILFVLLTLARVLPFRRVFVALTLGMLVTLGMARDLEEHRYRVELSRQQHRLLSATVEEIGALSPQATVVLLAEPADDLHLQTGYIDGFNVYGMGLDYLYRLATTNNTWDDSRRGCIHLLGDERLQCNFTPDGLRFYHNDTELIPYDRLVVLRFLGAGRVRLLDALPDGLLPESAPIDTYNPYALIDPDAPPPSRVYTLFTQYPMPAAYLDWEATAVPVERPLISVSGGLRINPVVDAPFWGVEEYNGDSYVWLGPQSENNSSLRFEVWSANAQTSTMQIAITPGPSREDTVRTLLLTVVGEEGDYQESITVDEPQHLNVELRLFAGYNTITLAIAEEATIAAPNGDPRPLLARIDNIAITLSNIP